MQGDGIVYNRLNCPPQGARCRLQPSEPVVVARSGDRATVATAGLQQTGRPTVGGGAWSGDHAPTGGVRRSPQENNLCAASSASSINAAGETGPWGDPSC